MLVSHVYVLYSGLWFANYTDKRSRNAIGARYFKSRVRLLLVDVLYRALSGKCSIIFVFQICFALVNKSSNAGFGDNMICWSTVCNNLRERDPTVLVASIQAHTRHKKSALHQVQSAFRSDEIWVNL